MLLQQLCEPPLVLTILLYSSKSRLLAACERLVLGFGVLSLFPTPPSFSLSFSLRPSFSLSKRSLIEGTEGGGRE